MKTASPKTLTTLTAWILLALNFARFAAAQDRALPAQTGTQWYPFLEWRIENPSHDGNPFDLEAKAVFLHQGSGETVTTGLFYDGGDAWAFRFTGTRLGEWTFRTASADQDLHGWSGAVTITENADPDAHGFMKAFGSKWGWEGTEEAFVPQYVMAKELPAYLTGGGAVDTAKVEADVREFVEGHGFTGFHLRGGAGWFDGENPDTGFYRAVEALIRRVHESGGASHLWMWGAGRDEDDEGPVALAGGPMSEVDRRNLRYLAARLGPLPGWSMGYGFDTENAWATVEELDRWKAFLEERMGYDHFLGARVSADDKGLWAVEPRPPKPPLDAANNAPIGDAYLSWSGGDYTGYTSYRPLYPRYVQAMQHRPEKPSFEEDRFRLRDRENWAYKDYSAELTRRGLWHSAMAGGAANIWGNLLPEADEGGSQPYPIKEQIKTYARFFEGRFLKEMQTVYDGPELRLVTPEGTHTIVYREDTDVVRLDLSGMDKRGPAVAVDAKKAYEEIELGPLAPEQQTWEAPYRSDWAIAVGDFE